MGQGLQLLRRSEIGNLNEDGWQFSDLAYQTFSRLVRAARSSFSFFASPATSASNIPSTMVQRVRF